MKLEEPKYSWSRFFGIIGLHEAQRAASTVAGFSSREYYQYGQSYYRAGHDCFTNISQEWRKSSIALRQFQIMRVRSIFMMTIIS